MSRRLYQLSYRPGEAARARDAAANRNVPLPYFTGGINSVRIEAHTQPIIPP